MEKQKESAIFKAIEMVGIFAGLRQLLHHGIVYGHLPKLKEHARVSKIHRPDSPCKSTCFIIRVPIGILLSSAFFYFLDYSRMVIFLLDYLGSKMIERISSPLNLKVVVGYIACGALVLVYMLVRIYKFIKFKVPT